jgi:hypothetical protein
MKVNKFEALKQFQAWPPEHQRLCAEYWIETVEVEPTQVWTLGERLSVSPIPFDRPKAAAKVAAVPARNNMRYTRDELTEVDLHVSEGRGPSEIALIMDRKYPRQRTIVAWEVMANRIKKVGLQAMLKRANDVEFK